MRKLNLICFVFILSVSSFGQDRTFDLMPEQGGRCDLQVFSAIE